MPIKDHPNYAALVTLIGSLITKIRNKQAEYYTEKGKYFQGLRTPATGKTDGLTLVQIAYGLHPADQEDSWNTFDAANFKSTTKLPCHIRVDVYESPRGWGWLLIVDFWLAGLAPDAYGHEGDHWVFQHNEGPENMGGVWDEWFIEPTEMEPV